MIAVENAVFSLPADGTRPEGSGGPSGGPRPRTARSPGPAAAGTSPWTDADGGLTRRGSGTGEAAAAAAMGRGGTESLEDDAALEDEGPEALPDEPPFEGVDPSTVELPEGDNAGIESEDDEQQAYEPELEFDGGFGNTIVVDGLPEVAPEKYEKLQGVLVKIFSQVGRLAPGGVMMPMDKASNLSKGFAIVEFSNPREAKMAKDQLNGYKLGKGNTFRTDMLDDIMRYSRVADEYVVPAPPAYKPGENTMEWMMDARGRDQFCLRYQDMTEIYWNEPKTGSKEEVYKRKFWTEKYCIWSGQGNMMATMHGQGIQLWGGNSFGRIMRFMHPGVDEIDISPDENYLVSFSAPGGPLGNEVVIMVWEIRTGQKLREFRGGMDDFPMGGRDNAFSWPIMQWGGGKGDNYFAKYSLNKAGQRIVSVYETPGMNLLEKKSIAATTGIQDLLWSPTDNILACYMPMSEDGNTPAKVCLIEIPSRKEIRSKNLFNVAVVNMYWQAEGKYFAVHVSRYTKSKKSQYHGFELFRTKEAGCPMEVMDPPDKNVRVQDFAWEPKGNRFAIIHGDTGRPDVSFYTMVDGKDHNVKLLKTLKGKSCNRLFWSPQGSYVILAGLGGLNGQFEFYNAEEQETMASGDHFMCTHVDWDPTGRYVVTSVNQTHQMENGVMMWNFMGDLLFKVNLDNFYQFMWRPRTEGLLDPEKERDIRKNLRKYTKRFEEQDQALKNQANVQKAAERKKLDDEWAAFLAAKVAWVKEHQAEYDALASLAELPEGSYEFEEVERDEVIELREEVID